MKNLLLGLVLLFCLGHGESFAQGYVGVDNRVSVVYTYGCYVPAVVYTPVVYQPYIVYYPVVYQPYIYSYYYYRLPGY